MSSTQTNQPTNKLVYKLFGEKYSLSEWYESDLFIHF